MKEKNDGGPAFPESCNGSIISGMTLRDYFAGQAIVGYTSATDQEGTWATDDCEHEIAERCYSIADAMLKERDK